MSELSVAVENSTAVENEARPTTVMQINAGDKKKFAGANRQRPRAIISPQYCNLVKWGGNTKQHPQYTFRCLQWSSVVRQVLSVNMTLKKTEGFVNR